MTSTPSSSTWRPAGATAGSTWSRSGIAVPVFYFSNPAGVIGHEAEVWAPRGSEALDYELELACVIGRAARDLPADDRALECVAGFTIMNDWSARDLQRVEMAVGLGRARARISRPRSAPSSSASTSWPTATATAASTSR